MNSNHTITDKHTGALLDTHTILRNTYLLLSLTLLFSAFTAGIATHFNAFVHPLVHILGYFGLLKFTRRFKDSTWGLFGVFALTGFIGYTLGPILNYALAFPRGNEIIAMSLGGTGLVFLALSGYALISQKDFSFIRGFVLAGLCVILAAIFANLFFEISGLELTISAMMILFSSSLILLQTSEIIQGGETNYIIATIGLYISLYSIFTHLLQILIRLNNRRN